MSIIRTTRHGIVDLRDAEPGTFIEIFDEEPRRSHAQRFCVICDGPRELPVALAITVLVLVAIFL